MAVDRPDSNDIASAAKHFGLNLDADDRAELTDLVDGALGSYDVVEDLYAAQAPQAPARDFERPSAEQNPLNAWMVTTDIKTLAAQDGPLGGRTVAIKDNFAVAGVPMANGSRAFEGFVPSVDATVVSRLLDAGATVAGKSSCEDLCFSGSSFTSFNGPVLNPWDRGRETGGSSSGSAALVANGDVDLALGTDTGGSVRMPAAFCGVVGLKPTYGLVPTTGVFPIERTLDHVGPIARTVEDAALLLSVIAGHDPGDPSQHAGIVAEDYLAGLRGGVDGMRIGVVEEGFGHEASQPGVNAAVRAAAALFTQGGAAVESVRIPWHLNAFHVWNVIATDGAAYQMLDGNGQGLGVEGLYDPERMAYFAKGRIKHADDFAETVKLVALCGYHGLKALGGASYAKARNLVAAARADYDRVLDEYDVLVMPTVPYVASELPGPGVDRATYLHKALGMLANTAPIDATGHPALTVPTGLVDGLPVGMMIIGRHFEDQKVLQVGHAFETLRGDLPRSGTLTQLATAAI